MKKAKTLIIISGGFMLLFSYGNMSGNTGNMSGSASAPVSSQSAQTQTKSTQTQTKSTQTQTKTTQTQTKTTQKKPATKPKSTSTGSKPVAADSKSVGTVKIGTQYWALTNLNVDTFRNGDSIPEAKTNNEWVEAGQVGKPAWCYYNNDSKNGVKYGKLYNWYAVNDPRGLAPAGWTLAGDADWTELTRYLGGQAAGNKIKSTSGWVDGNNGTNDAGFTGLPGGYRIENGTFKNLGNIGTWWSSTEGKALTAVDYYLALNGNLGRSSSPRQRGESVRCLKK
jgi:uncharacterized protein (TIGR02145 family)